ncbi:hypothetical protein HK101_006601, partial [Irineochytrium annulatum]
MSHVRAEVVPLIDAFSAGSTQFLSSPADDWKTLREQHARIGELLLQSLLKIDGVQVPAFHEDVRARRKECVREVNALLDRVDGVRDR